LSVDDTLYLSNNVGYFQNTRVKRSPCGWNSCS